MAILNLLELTASEISILDREKTVVIIPLGSAEQHASHLPVGTKGFIAEAVSYSAAKQLQNSQWIPLISPSVSFMPSNVNYGFTGNFSMGARTFSDACYDIGNSFQREGFKWLYFVNMSISPDALKAVMVAVEDLNTLRDFKAFDPMPLWNFSPNPKVDSYVKNLGLTPEDDLHAGAKETSCILHLDKTMVKEDILPDMPPCRINASWEVLKGHFSFIEMGSEYGYLGDPRLSDAELGKLYLDEAAFGLSEAIKFTKDGNELPELPIQIRMLLKMVDLDEM